eukprot:1159938-Pelagomonas_calceolata.AAC.12
MLTKWRSVSPKRCKMPRLQRALLIASASTSCAGMLASTAGAHASAAGALALTAGPARPLHCLPHNTAAECHAAAAAAAAAAAGWSAACCAAVGVPAALPPHPHPRRTQQARQRCRQGRLAGGVQHPGGATAGSTGWTRTRPGSDPACVHACVHTLSRAAHHQKATLKFYLVCNTVVHCNHPRHPQQSSASPEGNSG